MGPLWSHQLQSKHQSSTMKVTVSAVLLCSLLLSCQAAPAPLIDPVSSSFALGGLTGSFALAEGLTLGLAASSTTIPTWLLALKAGLLGKSLLLSAGTAGAD